MRSVSCIWFKVKNTCECDQRKICSHLVRPPHVETNRSTHNAIDSCNRYTTVAVECYCSCISPFFVWAVRKFFNLWLFWSKCWRTLALAKCVRFQCFNLIVAIHLHTLFRRVYSVPKRKGKRETKGLANTTIRSCTGNSNNNNESERRGKSEKCLLPDCLWVNPINTTPTALWLWCCTYTKPWHRKCTRW